MRFWAYRPSCKTLRRRYRFPEPARSHSDLLKAILLWEEAADQGGFRDAANGEDHGAGARGDVMLAHGVHHLVEGADHDLLQARIHFVGVPHQPFLVLHPFKVADGAATG